MPTKSTSTPAPIADPLALKELAGVLVRHYGIKEGLYDLLVQFQIGVGTFGPDASNLGPGATVTLAKVGLVQTQVVGPSTVDAKEVNPAPKRAHRKAEA